MSETQRISWGKPRRPSDADRDALRAELLAQARAVRTGGWDELSPGRAAVIAYLLGDADVLAELQETEHTVLSRFAADLFGFAGGRKDNEKGLVDTQAWLAGVRSALS